MGSEMCIRDRAILLRQYLGDAMKPMLSGGLMNGMNPSQKGIYQDMMVNTLADQISSSGQFGLSRMFQMQLMPKNTVVLHGTICDTSRAP